MNDTDDTNEKSCKECDLEFHKEEWRITIETQMHFNDLIMKYRTTVLSIYISSLAIIYGLGIKLDMLKEEMFILFVLVSIFWICCFMLDYFYYNRLLIGSVEHAHKFDEDDFFKKRNLFGLTKSIKNKISINLSKKILFAFYTIPIIAAAIVIIIRMCSNQK